MKARHWYRLVTRYGTIREILSKSRCRPGPWSGALRWPANLRGPASHLLLPIEKARGGEEAPPFVVEILYVIRGTAWREKWKARLALPTLDTKTTAPFLTFKNAQRENGEVLVEGQAQWNSRPPKAA